MSENICQRIEAVRQYFELADNWPTEPFRLNAWSWVADPAELVDGHLTFLLSVENDALKVPYLERLEGVMQSQQAHGVRHGVHAPTELK